MTRVRLWAPITWQASTASWPLPSPSKCPREEIPLKVGKGSQHIEVQAFLILERVTDSKHFLISVLLQSGGRFIGKTSRGTVTEGQEIWLSLRWDQPQQRFVASSQAAG